MRPIVATVGRFQTPYLHKGHLSLLEKCFKSAGEKVIIFVGVSGMNPTTKNPLSFEVIRDMLMEWYYSNIKNVGPDVEIRPLKDVPFSHELWSENLNNELCNEDGGLHEVLLIGGRDSFLKHYEGIISSLELPLVGDSTDAATVLRAEVTLPQVVSHGNIQSKRFREGIIYGSNRSYPNIYPVVDIVAFKEEDNTFKFLIGRKHGEKQWRIPGGFVDVTDANLEEAAARELEEECGDLNYMYPVYLGSCMIDDRRYKGCRDQVFSTAFSINILSGTPMAGDDLAEVTWATAMEIVHLDMINEHAYFITKFESGR